MPKGNGLKRSSTGSDLQVLDWIWGNGESAWKLLRAVLILLALIAFKDIFAHRDPSAIDSYLAAAMQAPPIFLGTLSPSYYSAGYLSAIIFCRLVAFAFMMSIVIKHLEETLMHIYAFGSVCRGEVRQGSDVDLLALVDGYDSRFDPDIFSVYSYGRIVDLWREGNPFAWHLFLESTLIFASDGSDFLNSLNSPGDYTACLRDCEKFYGVFCEAYDSIASRPASKVFELSTLFLSIPKHRDLFFAGCYGGS